MIIAYIFAGTVVGAGTAIITFMLSGSLLTALVTYLLSVTTVTVLLACFIAKSPRQIRDVENPKGPSKEMSRIQSACLQGQDGMHGGVSSRRYGTFQ